MNMSAGVLTTSDRSARGERLDESGPLLAELLTKAGFSVVETILVPDEIDQIERALLRLLDAAGCSVVATTGGTGLHPRDVTPEATRRVIEKEVPGIAEAMRAESNKITPFGMVSRGLAGIRKSSLLINFPGSPKAIRETFPVVKTILPHVVKLLQGGVQDCATQLKK